MSKKGGYQIISLLQPVLLSALALSNGKAVLLTDINIGGVKKKDVFAQVEEVTEDEETKYVIKGVYGYNLIIDSDGEITWSEQKFGTKLYRHQFNGLTFNNGKTLVVINEYPEPMDVSALTSKRIIALGGYDASTQSEFTNASIIPALYSAYSGATATYTLFVPRIIKSDDNYIINVWEVSGTLTEDVVTEL